MRGTGLILLLFLSGGFFHYSRWAHLFRDEPPAVVRFQPQMSTIAVTDEDDNYRLYQFSDEQRLSDVIKLTKWASENKMLSNPLNDERLSSGELIKLVKLEGDYIRIERSWLPAQNRILLQIPLHPDRMSARDWEFLPGIGPGLAQSIESDRQKNGNFIEFKELKRVKGIGPKKLDAWHVFFEGNIGPQEKNNLTKTVD